MVKNYPARGPRFDPWVGKIPWRRAWQPTPVFLPGEPPWTEEPGGLQSIGGCKESDMTKQLSMHIFVYISIYTYVCVCVCVCVCVSMFWGEFFT